MCKGDHCSFVPYATSPLGRGKKKNRCKGVARGISREWTRYLRLCWMKPGEDCDKDNVVSQEKA